MATKHSVFRKQLRQTARVEFLKYWHNHAGENDEAIRVRQMKPLLINQAFLNKVFRSRMNDLHIILFVTNLDFSLQFSCIYYRITFNSDTYQQMIIIIRLFNPELLTLSVNTEGPNTPNHIFGFIQLVKTIKGLLFHYS
jgi:hypothetical protein